jgi:geranylgeranyl pyrophosphate synthase
MHEIDVPDAAYRPLLRLFSRIACQTGAGQADDITQSHAPLNGASEGELLHTCQRKTAAYTFEGPILSGAILAGVPAEAHRAISAFASALGKIYQIQNDMEDLSHSAHVGCDLIQGKRTLILMRGRAAMDPAARLEFDRRLDALPGANGQSLRMAEMLRQDLLAAGAVQFTRQVIAGLVADARAAASDPGLTPAMSGALRSLLRHAEREYSVPV